MQPSAAANKRAEGRKRSLGQEAVPGEKVFAGRRESQGRERRFNARAGRVPALKLMGGVGVEGYRDVFDIAVAIQTAQLPIRMAAARTFKAGIAGCVYNVHTRACGVRPDESVRGWEDCGRYTGSRIVEETPRGAWTKIVDAKKGREIARDFLHDS